MDKDQEAGVRGQETGVRDLEVEAKDPETINDEGTKHTDK